MELAAVEVQMEIRQRPCPLARIMTLRVQDPTHMHLVKDLESTGESSPTVFPISLLFDDDWQCPISVKNTTFRGTGNLSGYAPPIR